jgi:amino acid permease
MDMGLQASFIKQRKLQRYQMAHVTKLTPFETYIAVIKGYCAILILFIPSTYVNGGWGMSSFLFLFAAIISTICVVKLIEAGMKLGIYSYGGIVQHTLGTKAKFIADVMIAATQYSFTISHFTFETQSLKSSVDGIFGFNSPTFYYAAFILMICIPLAWIRDIGKLSWTFFVGNFVILATVIVVLCYCTSSLVANGPGPDLEFWNR